MCKQVAKEDSSLCYEIGKWDSNLSPTYDVNGWQFEYQNGTNIP